ncbi:MAG: DinB family protein [Acidobacteriaceae bacterium]|nr:DinB family protein [Acidobacteriaceae bacterium]
MDMKLLALLALLPTAVVSVASAAESTHVLTDDLVKHWQTSRDFSVAVAEAMPEDAYSFKASEPEMNFGEQINHIALANANYCSAALGTKSSVVKGADNSKNTAIKNLEDSYDFCLNGLKKLSDAELQDTVSTRSGSITKFDLFWGAFTHAAHHRGQTEVYLRLKGITPPAYKF